MDKLELFFADDELITAIAASLFCTEGEPKRKPKKLAYPRSTYKPAKAIVPRCPECHFRIRGLNHITGIHHRHCVPVARRH